MDKGGKLQTGMFLGLFVSLVLYHVGNLVKTQFIQPVSNVYDLINLVQLAVTVAVFFLFVFNKLVARIIFRDSYIGGKYEGKSTHHEQNEDKFSVEKFSISQNLFEATISGRSLKEADGSLTSIWTGRLFKVEGNIYYFGVELSVATGEVGVFKLIFERDEVHGFYYSGKPLTKHAYNFWAKRVKESPASILLEALQW